MKHPIKFWIDHAVEVAMKSPCQSKRGVVICHSDGWMISDGFNDQLFPFVCDGSEECKRNCSRTAIHAEQASILNARSSLKGAWMLHVKARGGKPCASMAPSCLECSKLILYSQISWMHLLHDPQAQMLPGAKVVATTEGFTTDGKLGELQVRRYSAADFHYLTTVYSRRFALSVDQVGGAK